ncbi:threonine/serine dehydratase [Pelagibius litoralis]|uniref:Threonine/serine dehydratase n=1 Tax=Pelagibius litoralis TaxID=374515 RepID=A0A967F1B9_9PROT|nr:threonine/serine dehydratase [Pelagibius litoralis]NIA71177.1 threonine/serine dehydratase [Pelagibius litoralis]
MSEQCREQAISRDAPDLAAIEAAAQTLKGRIVETPVVPLVAEALKPHLPGGAEVIGKLELFQHAGSFKARGALLNILDFSDAEAGHGATAVSAGNHALAVAWAARQRQVHAKVVMMKTADPVRVAGCRALGAEVVQTDDIHGAFAEVDRIVAEEGRRFIHPFESPLTVLGTATCGREAAMQMPDLDVMVIPVGGGGLIAGMARAMKLLQPNCRVIGVEPEGADSLTRSFAAGSPQTLEKVDTIADSLGAPMTLPYSFAVARDHVDELVRIRDDDMLRAMGLIYDGLKIAVEPAGAASTAAVMGPLKQACAGKRVGVIFCGSNIGEERFAALVAKGRGLA